MIVVKVSNTYATIMIALVGITWVLGEYTSELSLCRSV